MTLHTTRLVPTAAGLADAAKLLQNGALVAFPTETVYGLGADARQGEAVARIYTAKGRPTFNPLIVHVADSTAAKTYVEWPAQADTLARLFWPGPLTLVLPLRAGHGLSPLVTAGLPTVGIRVPAHTVAHELLRAFGGPVAAPSANPSGRISPTTADHVVAGLKGRIAAVVDGGACDVGLESTIIGFDGPNAVLLREGGLPSEQIETALGTPLLGAQAGAITAPGQMSSHYAPKGAVRLNAISARRGEHFLGFGAIAGDLTLSASGDTAEAAANLFGHLHRLDAMGGPIAVAPIPMEGLGRAINDRLARAAAPRD
ncbi:L-threonylcarbamoyladenylate synthase [Sulfitobacter guttiformis]|uniref:Threonylcarbamoyl-AMP synthase n=1 Tax=Sulfitobacter guttiformis TaxID=74349 RepID=A0A420DQ23_9RHOB|nr:L-threonylcarbamoyladenylate synthase [Sulfitobacter guttiformis]KIN73767.1 Sua5/YciO/YrdC family protein [Sulfitobacter guttiformis KCTC 32187]RKE96401.1 translation factor SUA5 [Sulfitobacter guttiformis]